MARITDLLNASTFKEIVGGRRRGAGPSLLRGTLRIGESGYAAAVRLRNALYDLGVKKAHRAGAPVVSVGNLTLGGTGKTPMVRWLAEWFRDQGIRPAVVSRGYGSTPGEANDEALELRLLLPGVPHLQNPDRVASAREAVEKLDCNLILLDDGFQHRRIARDFDIVLIDASAPFGFGHVFPRGLLREPASGLRRADAVVLTRADLIEPADRKSIWQAVRRHAPRAIRAEAIHAPRDKSTGSFPMVAAFCGIGNPAGFRHTIEQCGYRIAAFREFPDHHRYNGDDLASLDHWAGGLDVSAVLCTCKDLVKINRDRLGRKPLSAVRIDVEFLAGREALESRLKKIL